MPSWHNMVLRPRDRALAQALMLLERFAVTNYPGPSNDRETWKTPGRPCLLRSIEARRGSGHAEGIISMRREV